MERWLAAEVCEIESDATRHFTPAVGGEKRGMERATYSGAAMGKEVSPLHCSEEVGQRVSSNESLKDGNIIGSGARNLARGLAV